MSDVARLELRKKWEALSLSSAELTRRPDLLRRYLDLDGDFWPLYDLCHKYTMTSIERLYDLHKSVEYVIRAGIHGGIIECGVWKGGSMMMVAATLKALSAIRPLFLFDTFEGLPPPDAERDVDLLGQSAIDRWRPEWAKGSLGEVQTHLALTGYPHDRINFIGGMVEDTLLKFDSPVAIARLDTDWHSSTKVELEVLWPLISPGGLLIIDDYGHWQGARQATDEFFANKPNKLVRIDYSCRVVQK